MMAFDETVWNIRHFLDLIIRCSGNRNDEGNLTRRFGGSVRQFEYRHVSVRATYSRKLLILLF